MLSLHPVSSEMGRHYYKEENYYSLNNAGQNSAWQGRGAQELGLAGPIDARTFERLLQGLHPTREEDLRLKTKGSRPRAGIDLTFSAPKSVSLAALVGGDTRLEDAHRMAVSRALDLAEARYAKTRVGSSEARVTEVTENLTVALFHHDTSRAKDPQLHTHCVVLNTVQRADGQWRSLSNEDFYRHSKLLGLVYQNELAREVRTLGYQVEPQANGTFELTGYSEKELRSFSKRREQIAELGATSQKEARQLVLKNRPTKGPPVSRETLQSIWTHEAKALGIKHPIALQRGGEIQNSDARDILKAAVRHSSERDVQFRREDLERFALEAHLSKIEWQDLQRSIRGAETFRELIALQDGRFTTKEALVLERDIIRRLMAGKKASLPLSDIPHDIRANTLGLSQGQKTALEMSISSSDRFMGWQGVAGAGKTFAMRRLRELADAEGVTLRGFAPSAEAAKVLEVESGIQADTVASLLYVPTPRPAGKAREIWIVDEAGLLSARQCAGLMQKADAGSITVILVGDTRQLSSVEAGNPFKLLQQHGMTTAHLTESRRQRDDRLKAAASAMAQGNMQGGLGLLGESIHEIAREKGRLRKIAETYVALPAEDRSKALVLAGTNKMRESLTQLIREGLAKHGVVKSEQKVACLKAKDLTREEARAGLKIEPGNVLVFHAAERRAGIKPGDQLHVTGVDRIGGVIYGALPQGQRVVLGPRNRSSFTVYEVVERSFAVGDQVRWTRNDKTLGLRNGQELRVVAMGEDQMSVKSQNGATYHLTRSMRPFLDHNYVHTVYSAQGKTCDRVLVAADATYGKEALYVAVTRARDKVALFTRARAQMESDAERCLAKGSASDLLPMESPQNILDSGQQKRGERPARQRLGGLRMR